MLRPVVWLGDSRRNIQAFPVGARKLVGDELQLVQFGSMPNYAKPFHGVGSGVFRDCFSVRDERVSHTVFAVQLGAKIYVLHAFQKKSKVRYQNAPERY